VVLVAALVVQGVQRLDRLERLRRALHADPSTFPSFDPLSARRGENLSQTGIVRLAQRDRNLPTLACLKRSEASFSSSRGRRIRTPPFEPKQGTDREESVHPIPQESERYLTGIVAICAPQPTAVRWPDGARKLARS